MATFHRSAYGSFSRPLEPFADVNGFVATTAADVAGLLWAHNGAQDAAWCETRAQETREALATVDAQLADWRERLRHRERELSSH